MTVGLALAMEHRPPVVVYQVQKTLPFQEKVRSEVLEKNVFEALTGACDTLVRDGLPHITSRRIQKGLIDEIHIVYASPWHLSQAKTLTITNDTPFVVTEKLVQESVSKETQNMVTSSVLAEARVTSEMSVIEERVTNIALNGYDIDTPFGKKTQKLTMTLFVSALEKQFREKIEEIVNRFVHAKDISHHSLPLAFFSTVRDAFAVGKDFLLICAGEEITDIAYARGEILRDTASFPWGRAHIIRSLAKDLSCLPEEAESLLNTQHLETLRGDIKEESRQALEKACSTWAGYLRETVKVFSGSGALPRALFLITDEESDVFKKTLERGELFGKSGSSAFDVTAMNKHILAPFCKAAGAVKKLDPRIAVATLYAQTLSADPKKD